MCYQGKFFYCIPVKTACYVLAIINAIVNAVTLGCFSIQGVVYLLAAVVSFCVGGGNKTGGDRFKRSMVVTDQGMYDYWVPFEYLLPLCWVFSLLTFIFSVLLCCGLDNCKVRQVRAYFIYGCIVTVLAFLASMVQIIVKEESLLGLWGLMGCALHSLFLVLVHYTHAKMAADAMFTDHRPLNDEHSRDSKRDVKLHTVI
ncbi:uncharacterized protein LOC134797058 [Cydia splendana]|uniref:uncharacterized protein LOC134797058 n=1 Tax=Cydia splendana TaxID=1100963 RepID=UPI0028F47C93